MIDPTLVYATFVGGSDTDTATAIAVDAVGAIYVAGQTISTDFPAAGTTPPTVASGDVFVAKLNAAGTALLYTAIVGGSSYDVATGLAVDGAGQIWVTGATISDDFPTLNGYRTTFRGGSDAFVLRLDPGGALAYSTFLGADFASAIAVAPSGPAGATEVFITGSTSATDFPVLNAFQSTFGGAGFGDLAHGDAFVIKLDGGGNPLYATYLGGNDDDAGTSIAADASGNAYIIGVTASTDFPVASAIQAVRAGDDVYNYDLFVAKVNPAGSALVYSTYLGGSSHELDGAIRVDSAGRAVVTGCTMSDDFPTRNALQGANAGGVDAVVAKLSADGSALAFSTYFGGEGVECGVGVGLGPGDDIFIVGTTTSTTFPLRLPVQADNNGSYDAFVARLASDGSSLVYATYYGGGGEDWGTGIAVDANGVAYVVGVTDGGGPPYGPWFPTTVGSAQPVLPGRYDAFVLKIAPNTQPTITNPGDQISNEGSAVSLAVGASDPDGDTLTFSATGLPPGIVMNAATGVITGTLPYTAGGQYVTSVTVSDGHGGTASTSFHWTVADVNRPPVLDPIGSKTVPAGTTLSFTVTASDADGDPLTFAAQPMPANATFEAPTFTFTPTAGQIGTYNSVTFNVTDGRGASASETIVLRVVRTIAIAITSPPAGMTIPAGSLIVQGTVDTAGEDVGVSVNGFVAAVEGGTFAAQLPVTPGVTMLTATAHSPNGGGGTVAISVTVSASSAERVLSATPTSGAAPLSVEFAVVGVAPASIVLDLDGDGTPDFMGPTLSGQRFMFNQPGLYLPRVTVTDSQGGQSVLTAIVHVQSAAAVEGRFSALWGAFKARLQAGDIAGALEYVAPVIRPRFEFIFQTLGSNLSTVAAGLEDILALRQEDNLAEAVLVRQHNGQPYLYFVYFRRDSLGRWLLEEM